MITKTGKEIEIRELRIFEVFKARAMYKKMGHPLPFYFKYIFLFILFYIIKKVLVFVALDKEEIIGIAYINSFRKSNFGIKMLKEYQAQGIGTELARELLKNRKEIYLQVYEDNKIAIRLYKKAGFKIIRRILIMKR